MRTNYANPVCLLLCVRRIITACPATTCSAVRWRVTALLCLPSAWRERTPRRSTARSCRRQPCCCRLPSRSRASSFRTRSRSYFAVAIYKVYRYLYMADPAGVDAVFRAPQDRFEYLCDARMKEHELKIRLAANGEEGCGLTQENIRRMPLAPSEIARRYPDLSSALLRLCSAAGVGFDRLEK